MPAAVIEKGQYALAFVVVAAMLVVAGFPAFVVFFFGIFAYFLWKIFSGGSRSETREIFEFYLAANEMLRDDERRWYGFEIREVISRGERVIHAMSGAPPLVYFTLGALYNKIGENREAVANLSNALENEQADEINFVFPSPELRNYVKVLRKIEREPAEAPLTSAAVRSLERARRLRGKALLEESRRRFESVEQQSVTRKLSEHGSMAKNADPKRNNRNDAEDFTGSEITRKPVSFASFGRRGRKERETSQPSSDRQTISEVLHDIYDKNAH